MRSGMNKIILKFIHNISSFFSYFSMTPSPHSVESRYFMLFHDSILGSSESQRQAVCPFLPNSHKFLHLSTINTLDNSHESFVNISGLQRRSFQIKQFILLRKLRNFLLPNAPIFTQIRLITSNRDKSTYKYTHDVLVSILF